MKPISIVSAKRTPQGRFPGLPAKHSAVELAVVQEMARMREP